MIHLRCGHGHVEEVHFKNEFSPRECHALGIFSALFITGLLTSNILGSKIIQIFGLQMPSATIAYALTYLMTDVVGELYGKKEADRLVLLGFVCLVLSTLIIRLAIVLPSPNDSTAFNQIFNSTTRIIFGSLAGYIVSQTIDVFIFHKIREISVKYKFIRNNVSTIISQLFDTVVFSFVAFYGVVPKISSLIWGVFLAKVFLALCDTPFFYLLTRKSTCDGKICREEAGMEEKTDEKGAETDGKTSE